MVKKVLLISYYWPPASGAGVQRWLKMSKYLPDFGISPVVITVEPSQASYPLSDESFLKEVRSDIEVIRTKSFEPLKMYGSLFGKKSVPYSGFANVETESLLSRVSRWVRGNFFIPDARKGWNKYALRAALKAIKTHSIDVVITTGPPHSTHLIGKRLKEVTGIRWIADFRDPWTDIYYYSQLSHTAWAKKMDTRLEKQVLNAADRVLSVCPYNQRLLQEKLDKACRDKVLLLPNGFDEGDFEKVERKEFSKFTMAYTGTLATSYEYEPLFEILSKLTIDWQLIVAGSISPEVEQSIRHFGLEERIDYRGYVSHDEVVSLIVSADLLLHLLPKGELGTSGKLFEYIGSGTPILNFGLRDGDAAYFLEQSQSGETFTEKQEDEILSFVRGIASGSLNTKSDTASQTRRVRANLLAEIIDKLTAG
jgi:glycosyltransferase involved in cell wall biosynthesis